MSSEKIRLLIVDDEVDLSQSIATYFEIFGYECLIADSGQAAIDRLAKETVQLVLTDVRMPKVSGIQLLDTIKARNVNTPKVLVISGFADISNEELYHKGADGFFCKPFDSRGMLDAIRRATVSLDELWKRPPSVEPEYDFIFDEKLPSPKIRFGRGGFSFVHGAEGWGVDDQVRFQLRLHESDLPDIRGSGVVRWRKAGTTPSTSKSGIEISYLDDQCRGSFVKWLEKRLGIPFIPAL